ncbi:MAG: type II secretion system protein [Planctomycetota bacterium]|nr:type II secretion system protein [Planctomycetota bacterium]
MQRAHERGMSLIGLLVVFVCIVILGVISLTALNKSITGEGSAQENTVRSVQDKMNLYAIHQALVANAIDNDGRFLTPSVLAGSNDRSLDTTANLFSAMVMHYGVRPEMLISGNEYNGYVVQDMDYDHRAYDPRAGVYWDPSFEADLERGSNVSFAHVPLFGDRFEKNWQTAMSSSFPILGNRGPKDGIHDPTSWTYGRNGTWGGHIVFGDGHIEFTNSFTPGSVFFERRGQRFADNIFAVEDGMDGADAILSFTKEMTREGPVLQFD